MTCRLPTAPTLPSVPCPSDDTIRDLRRELNHAVNALSFALDLDSPRLRAEAFGLVVDSVFAALRDAGHGGPSQRPTTQAAGVEVEGEEAAPPRPSDR